MITREEIQNQNLKDLTRVVIILCEILDDKELTEAEEKRLKYSTKVIKTVTKKHKDALR